MALAAKTRINTYDVEAYRVVESVQFTKSSGAAGAGRVTVHTADYPSAKLARDAASNERGVQGSTAFNRRVIPLNPEPTPMAKLVERQPNGTEISTPVPDMPAYKDLAGAPLSSWAPGVLAAGETLEGLTLHDLVYRFGYLVADKIPDNQSAARV